MLGDDESMADMTIRDCFAGEALAAVVTRLPMEADAAAKLAYAYADAMLRERQKGAVVLFEAGNPASEAAAVAALKGTGGRAVGQDADGGVFAKPHVIDFAGLGFGVTERDIDLIFSDDFIAESLERREAIRAGAKAFAAVVAANALSDDARDLIEQIRSLSDRAAASADRSERWHQKNQQRIAAIVAGTHSPNVGAKSSV